MRLSIAFVACGLIGAGCASQRDVRRLEGDLRALKAEAAERDDAPDTSSNDEALADLERRLAKLESWSSQSETHALGLASELDQLRSDVELLRRAAGDVGPGRFKKGDTGPPGLSEREIRQYAIAQGDPHFGRFGLSEAFAGDPTLADRRRGKLIATFDTTAGRFDCVLHENEAPQTVANFVGLVRGRRASLDAATGVWSLGRFYDGLIFHRVIKGFMIQGGDPDGSGKGGPGYMIADEIDPSLTHEVGTLSMANRGKNTASSQFFIMVAKTPHLDGRHTVFGQCGARIPKKISKVPVDPRRGSRPLDEVRIRRISISRKRG